VGHALEDSYEVVILGGGLAGLTLALQIKKARPETSILIAEKREGPAPKGAFKVGESTIELGATYFRDVVGMKEHLESEHVEKAGLRFFFPAGDNSDITQRVEWGSTGWYPMVSHQIDRGTFENALMDRNRAAEGTDVPDGCSVEKVELDADGGHKVTVNVDGESHTVDARWVVDATGRTQMLKKQLGLGKEVEHTINAAWFRLENGLDIEEWVDPDNDEWFDRIDERGIRKWSTNHLMGQGYWVWLIPLSSGHISIGIVADPTYHPFEEMDTIEKVMDWFEKHEPQLAATLRDRHDEVADFLKVEDFAYGCERVFSPERWALTGIAGTFLDPFYSPGSDYIGLSNTFLSDLVTKELNGEDISDRAEILNIIFLTMFNNQLQLYENLYQLWGNSQVMSAKLAWDFAIYWSSQPLLFIHEKWTDLDWLISQAEVQGRANELFPRVQSFFRQWHALEDTPRPPQFFSNKSFDAVWSAQTALKDHYDDEELKTRFQEGMKKVEAMAIVYFHEVAKRHLGDKAPPENSKIDALGISLDPDRWEEDGLFSDDGMTLAEARERAPGIDNIWLEEPVEA